MTDHIAESLTTAHDCAGFAARDLQAALRNATEIEALVIMPLIADAVRLQQQIAALINARCSASNDKTIER